MYGVKLDVQQAMDLLHMLNEIESSTDHLHIFLFSQPKERILRQQVCLWRQQFLTILVVLITVQMQVMEFGFFYLIVISIYTKEDFLGLSFAFLVDSFTRILHFSGCENLDL
jgi:hypothetical protein